MAFQIFGTINDPSAFSGYAKIDDANKGLPAFLSNLVTFIYIIAGLFVFINFILAGYQYLSANGDPQKIASAGEKMMNSLIGLIFVVASTVIAALLGQILFNEPKALLDFIIYESTP